MTKPMATRQAFGEALLALGAEREDFVVLGADLGKAMFTSAFQQKYPHRLINFGIAEQNLMTAAAGLATVREPVVACTYAVFAAMRACEQLRTMICYPNLNVKVIASHGGLHVGGDGVTHQGTEDIGIVRSFPNMTVVQPADARTTYLALKAILDRPGPAYLRLTRNPVPPGYDADPSFELGKGIWVKEDGQDVTLVATGVMVAKAIAAAEKLAALGITARVLDIHTIKPIDKDAILLAAKETGAIVTAEDHNIIGGLGSAVAEILAEESPVPMARIGLRDVFGESGDPEQLFAAYGLSADHIVEAAQRVVAKKA